MLFKKSSRPLEEGWQVCGFFFCTSSNISAERGWQGFRENYSLSSQQASSQFGFRQTRSTFDAIMSVLSLSDLVINWGGVILALSLDIINWATIRDALSHHRVPF